MAERFGEQYKFPSKFIPGNKDVKFSNFLGPRLEDKNGKSERCLQVAVYSLLTLACRKFLLIINSRAGSYSLEHMQCNECRSRCCPLSFVPPFVLVQGPSRTTEFRRSGMEVALV